MDLASLIGIILGAVMVVFGIITSGGASAFKYFIDVPSVVITIGGSISGTLSSHKMEDFIGGLKSISLAFKGGPSADPSEIIKTIIDLANVGRKEGLLALEEAANNIDDEFLKKGIMLVVDGTDPELVRGILETDLMCLEERHKNRIGFWEKWAELGPAWGMIGTLVGLVIMLYNMDDPSSIGPSMATALLTTLYGSLIANWLCNPIGTKLKVNNDIEVTMRNIMIEGLLSIQAGENPRVIEEKLKSFLAPAARGGVGADAPGAGGEE
ncbi:MAG: motility protein A [Muribaculaceae bacterium]|nr:motility protein A [Roseburia sp.]MCM1431069.1 motility protein A [Muribaculaceae bacterium]MCM1493329.1 motility protein A [Muribaculaceae bacterium]